MDLSVFSCEYEQARDKFLAAATHAGAMLRHWPHPLPGPRGEALATDSAWLGANDATRVLVILSATHGVEGFAGSGPQVDLLRGDLAARLPPDTAVLLVHAVNPHGFAWWRRVTEENVDLNRNWIDFSQPRPVNPGYETLREHYNPRSLDTVTLARHEAAIEAWRAQHGVHAERVARSSGQYTDARGIFLAAPGRPGRGARARPSCRRTWPARRQWPSSTFTPGSAPTATASPSATTPPAARACSAPAAGGGRA